MTDHNEEHAAKTRDAKVAAIVKVWLDAGATLAQAKAATPEQRWLAARIAGYHFPSETTWQLVLKALGET